jgi:hypothetical protein
MLATGAAAITAIGGYGAYLGLSRSKDTNAPTPIDDEPEVVGRTWKESAGRTSGRDGYVFGDLSRGVIVRVFGQNEAESADAAAEAQGDAQHSQVQRLVKEAVRVYRARGYTGSINMAQTVAYFNESVSVTLKGPEAGEPLPWQKADGTDKKVEVEKVEVEPADFPNDELAAAVAEEAISMALSAEDENGVDADASVAAIAKEGQAGLVFTTLLARLERRAKSWQAMSNDAGLDPMLTQAAQIGFQVPIVKLGWGVSVSLTVSASSLLRWAEHEAKVLAAVEAFEAE